MVLHRIANAQLPKVRRSNKLHKLRAKVNIRTLRGAQVRFLPAAFFKNLKMPYQPSDDTYLMSETLKNKIPNLLKNNKNLKTLEVGVGNGFQLETLFSLGIKKENILGSDVNPEAVEHCEKMGFRCINSDLFSNMGGGFDLIIFNPPYLPLDEREPKSSRKETTAGKKGNEIIIRFLKQAKKHLKRNGKIFLITSSLSEPIDFNSLDYKAKKINSKKLFFEELVVWELVLNKSP